MKKIGLVGGTGPESTIMYYKELNSKIDAATECKEMPELSIESVNFRKAWELVETKRNEELADYLSEKVNNLAIGDKLVKTPKNSKEVKVTGATLFKIKNGSVVKCYNGIEEITNILS